MKLTSFEPAIKVSNICITDKPSELVETISAAQSYVPEGVGLLYGVLNFFLD